MRHSKVAGFVAALFITASMLMGASVAFADTAPYDHQVQTAPGFYMVTVRDAPSSQGQDLGVLGIGTEYPAGAATPGPPNIYGGTWIVVKFGGTTGWVNSGMVSETALPVAKVAPAATPAKATPATSRLVTAAAPAGQVVISANIIWLALAGLLAIAAALVSFLTRRPVVQLSAAGIAAASAITMAFVRQAGPGLPTTAPTLAVALAASTAVFIAVLRRFDGEQPAMQLLRPAFRDWKFTAPVAAAALVPAIILAALGQSQLVSAAVVMTAAASVAAWRFAVFTNTDRPQPQQVEPDVYKPRGFDPSTEGARRG